MHFDAVCAYSLSLCWDGRNGYFYMLIDFMVVLLTGIVLVHIVPFIYDKYEDVIDHHAKVAADTASYHYKKVDDAVLRKIPRAPAKQKKMN